jgi:mannitol 2-dehydrogenase
MPSNTESSRGVPGASCSRAFFLACFARYLQGHDDAGKAYDVVGPTFSAADWVEHRSEDGLGLVRTSALITLRLGHHTGFASVYRTAASAIAQRGVGV